MRRERIGRHGEAPGEFASRQAFGFVPNQQPERLQPGWLGEAGEGGDGFIDFHISRYIEIYDRSMTILPKIRRVDPSRRSGYQNPVRIKSRIVWSPLA